MRKTTSSTLSDLKRLFTPVDDAINQLQSRRADCKLVDAVHNFLEFDIPMEFNDNRPTFYLPRHLATPSFEILFAIDFARKNSARLVIGQDKGGKFVGHSELKRPLGKLPIVVGKDKHGDDIIVNKSVINFSESQGKPISDVMTFFGLHLPELHAFLMRQFQTENVSVLDETKWINRYARDDIAKQYRRMLAYSCVYAVMVEWFTPLEHEFLECVIIPELEALRDKFGIQPLIVQLIDPSRDAERNWNAYPGEVLTRLETLDFSRKKDGRMVPK